MAAGHVHQITDVQVLHGKGLANVWYQETIDDTGSTNPIIDAAEAFKSGVIAQMVNGQSNQLNHDCILIRRVFPTTSPVEVVDVNQNGLLAGVSLPTNQALTLRKYSGNGDRNNRNRTFIAGVPEQDENAGRLIEAKATNYDIFRAAIIATITHLGRTYRIQNHSKTLNTFADLMETELNPILVKLRGRTPGICVIS